MKKSLLFIFIAATSFVRAENIIELSNEKTFDIGIKTRVEHWGIGDSKTDLFLAYLGSNEYQKCLSASIDSAATLTHLGINGDQCLYYQADLGRKKAHGKKVKFQDFFTLTTYDISTDFSKIDQLYDYDTSDIDYKRYTADNKPFINLENKEMYVVSNEIWNNSTDILDYSRKCFMYVAKTYSYGEPESGFKSLEYTIKYKRGDCGNLSSVFITLLRMKGIPARHLMGFRPDGSLHVWADFYLEGYGWIPVDVNYQHEYPNGDYFGYIKFEHSGFIVQRGIGHEISVLEQRKRITGLQTYTYQVAYTKSDYAKVYIYRSVECKERTIAEG